MPPKILRPKHAHEVTDANSDAIVGFVDLVEIIAMIMKM